jgi:hypothetical protein
MVNGKIEANSHFSKMDIRRMRSVENKGINGKIDIKGQANFKKCVEMSDVTLLVILAYESNRDDALPTLSNHLTPSPRTLHAI